ncbi:MAG: hypothetical protein KIT60_03575 [Burkholderiaceae bacterium]|nr:hypothetical protein [Burkholderiaceae bacterium]
MLMLFVRQSRPDSAYWPGRRALAAVDALAWPLAAAWFFANLPWATGIVGPFIVAAASLGAAWRLRVATLFNHRYRFTAWTWSVRVAAALTFGAVLKAVI